MWIKYKKKIICYLYLIDGCERISRHEFWGLEVNLVERLSRWEWCAKWVGKRKYQKKSHHKKKEVDEQAQHKKDWRRKRLKNRTKGKIGWGRGFSKKYYKQKANGQHRAWERDRISQEQWDDLLMDYTKVTHDPWDIY